MKDTNRNTWDMLTDNNGHEPTTNMQVAEYHAKGKEERKGLYQTLQRHIALSLRIQDQEGEITESDELELFSTKEAFDRQAESIVAEIMKQEDNTAAIDREIERLTALKQRKQKTAESLRKCLIATMQRMNIPRINARYADISLKRSERVEVYDNVKLPGDYYREKTTVEVNKVKITQDIRSGKVVPGARLAEHYNLVVK